MCEEEEYTIEFFLDKCSPEEEKLLKKLEELRKITKRIIKRAFRDLNGGHSL